MEVMMKELGEIITGNTPSKKTEEFWNSEDICFVKPDIIADNGVNEIVDSNEYISEDARKKARVVGKNSIFVTCIGSIGKIGIASDGEYAFNQQINAIIPNDRVQPKYLAYNLLFNKPRLVAIANAPVVPIINKSQFGEFTVNIETDIDRQCEIVDVLDKLTQIIQQRNKEISALDDLIKARFVELFGETETNPCKWPVAKLSEFCDLQNGYAFKSQDYIDNSSVLNCRMSNIRPDGGFDAEYHPKYLPDTFWEQYREYRLVDGDVIIAMTDMASDPKILGVPTIVRTNGKKFLLNQRVGKLTFYDNKAINNVYLMFVLSQKHIRQQLVKSAGGSTQINVGKPAVLGVEFLVPPMELQKQFAAFVEQTNKSKVVVQKALDEAQLLFDSLMQEYFG